MNRSFKAMMIQVLDRSRDMLLRPLATWNTVATEPGGLKEVFVPYVFVMSAVPSVVQLIAFARFGFASSRLSGRSVAASFSLEVFWILLYYAVSVASVFLLGKWMEAIAPFFGAKKSWVLSCRVLIYAATPLFVASILGLIPWLGIMLAVLTIPWSLALLYLGVGEVLETRGARQLFFTLAMVGSYVVFVALILMALRPLFPQPQISLAALPSDHSTVDPEAAMNSLIDQQMMRSIAEGQLKPEDAARAKAALIAQMRANDRDAAGEQNTAGGSTH